MNFEEQYLNLISEIKNTGERRLDRTGIGTLALFGKRLEIDISKNAPIITTKKVFVKPMIGELLWFLEGSTDERRLAEITYGTRDENRTTIWTGNALSPNPKLKQTHNRDLGRVYGAQWRRWVNNKGQVIDQIENVINSLKNNPNDRRHIVTAWNPGELDDMALPPCHSFMQFYLSNDKQLHCQMYQRSVDVFLGLPFNIASYALLTYMIAQCTDAKPGKLIMNLGDTHIYVNHLDQVNKQITNSILPFATYNLNPHIKNINDFRMSDIKVENYVSHPAIFGDMAV